jgi:hypothetical protein
MATISRQPRRSEAEILRNLDHIEGLLLEQRTASTYREKLKIGREIQRARAHEFARLYRACSLRPLPILGSPRNCTPASLQQRALWCELCGAACGRRDADHGREFAHSEGFCKAGETRQLYAVLVHSVWEFERIERFAHEFNLHARLVGWSWYGPQFTAALITRHVES